MVAFSDYMFDLDGYVFGRGQQVILDGEDGFSPGVAGVRVQDAEMDREDARAFGRDLFSGPTWSWSLITDRANPEQALATQEALATAWRAEDVRSTPGAVSVLRYGVGGRLRRVYGRPRRFAGTPNNRILSGVIPMTVDFQCADHLTYDDTQTTLTVKASASTNGGFVTPLITPVTTLQRSGSREGTGVVGGSAPTWAVVTFIGPSSNPRLELENGWVVGLNASIAAGVSVVLNPRPWARTVLRGGTASMAGSLTRDTRLAQMLLRPGGVSFTYSAEDPTGTSRATVAWRNATYAL